MNLKKIIEKNFTRLTFSPYTIEEVFRPISYEWHGDLEGRALLAFCCHRKINGQNIAWLEKFMEKLPHKLNVQGFLGTTFDKNSIDEQQLAGHSWLLRGLLAYDEITSDKNGVKYAEKIVNNLFFPALEHFDSYSLMPKNEEGDVSGNIISKINGWKLSSDIGCLFISLDGLSYYYGKTKDNNLLLLLRKITKAFSLLDFKGLKMQTHATLSATRGILKLYEITADEYYFSVAERVFNYYLNYGMTLTYENYNWFGREDSWTEPCAVVDSFILACKFYEITKEKKYLTLLRRIWFNGLQFCFRNNGGAGPNTCVNSKNRYLSVSMYEAYFCCTMRYAEGLLYAFKNESLLSWNPSAESEKDALGRVFVDDRLIVSDNGTLKPIFSCSDLSEQEAKEKRLGIIY